MSIFDECKNLDVSKKKEFLNSLPDSEFKELFSLCAEKDHNDGSKAESLKKQFY